MHLTHRVTTCPQTLCWDVTRLLGPRHPAERVRGTPVCLRGDGVLCKSVHLSSVKSPWLSGEKPEGFRMSNSAKLVTFKARSFSHRKKTKRNSRTRLFWVRNTARTASVIFSGLLFPVSVRIEVLEIFFFFNEKFFLKHI